jgi:hypothetical protein
VLWNGTTSTDYSIIVKLPFLVTIVFENAAHITGPWPLRSGEICPKLHLPVCDIGALLSRLQSFSFYLVKLSSIDCLPRPLALVSTDLYRMSYRPAGHLFQRPCGVGVAGAGPGSEQKGIRSIKY